MSKGECNFFVKIHKKILSAKWFNFCLSETFKENIIRKYNKLKIKNE